MTQSNPANRDPLSDAPGAHPVGTGIGAAGGAVTGAAFGAMGGPIGAAVGGVAGAVVGGLAGKGFHVTLWLAYFVDDQGRLVARISRDLGTAAVKGGAIGASKAHSAFVDVATALGHAAAASAGHVEGGAPQR